MNVCGIKHESSNHMTLTVHAHTHDVSSVYAIQNEWEIPDNANLTVIWSFSLMLLAYGFII